MHNTNAPGFRRLSETDRADMDVFVSQLVLTLPFLGFDLFRRAAAAAPPEGAGPDIGTFEFSTAVDPETGEISPS